MKRLALVLLLLASQARATVVLPLPFEDLVREADYIVRAVVLSVSSEWRTTSGQKHIITRVKLDVREVLAGTPPQPLELVMLGGQIGEVALVVDGVPRFQVGDEDILFVTGNGVQFCPLVAIMHGRYRVVRDAKTGGTHVARSNGAPMFDEKEVDQPMTSAERALAQHPQQRPLTPAAFAQKIRTAREKTGPKIQH